MTSKNLQPFEPEPGQLYDLDMAARLTGAKRRSILIYCRAGLIRPILQPPHDAMAFDDELMLLIRRIDRLHRVHGASLELIRGILQLMNEVEQLRAELRFLCRR